jgi:hypothetical protein
MTRLEFDDLVRRLERRYADRPKALQRACSLWVVSGLLGMSSWSIFFLALGVLLLGVGALYEPPLGIVLMIAGVFLVLIGISQAAQVLRIETGKHPGQIIGPGQAPALTKLLESLQRDMQCRPFDEVRISLVFNAVVRQVPRLGWLGWPRTFLELGLPLLCALSPEECRAVVAHEFVHLSKRHAGDGRLFLLRSTWQDLVERMQQVPRGGIERASRWVLVKFLAWYWPRLNARLIVLSRAHEYEADREAARLAGRDAVCTALFRIECLGSWLAARFWPAMREGARESADPPTDIICRLREGCRKIPADSEHWIDLALSGATACDDTHPAFLDRAQQLGWSAREARQCGFPVVTERSAAEEFLGEDLGKIERELSDEWRRLMAGTWTQLHHDAKAQANRPATGRPAIDQASTTVTHLSWESARELAEREGVVAAAPLLRELLRLDPGHNGAAALLGSHLVKEGDALGEDLLLGVIKRNDEDWLAPACEALEEYYRTHGRLDRVADIRARLDGHEAAVRAAQRERSAITSRDRFIDHGLGSEALQELQRLLAETPDLAHAWLARKQLEHFPHRALFLLCVASAGSGWPWAGTGRDHALVRQLSAKVKLPGQQLVIGARGPFRGTAKKIMSHAGAEVYARTN